MISNQDLVEALSQPWYVGRKADQSTYERDAQGALIKEATIPFEYHDGYLSVYYQVPPSKAVAASSCAIHHMNSACK